ncbi:dephospho-CoA kinase [Streptococcus halichoeri]|uniref:dephospho-CoA kinase n=1 Tax=Streptococcus halichoeri TaxID=254785 RepID=UPI00135A20B6|nr:dephospho-CoA kinase [Streptococcus halichoeri]
MTYIIGITGGIASGKSTVVSFLQDAGYQVIDADKLVHRLQDKGGKLYQVLVEYFGPAILDDAGEIDRPVLSRMLFNNPELMAQSARLQSSIIRESLRQAKDQLSQKESIFFMDIPLLIEQDYVGWFDAIWLVYVNHETQVSRLMHRNHYSKKDALKRLEHQMPLEAKKAVATVIIDNNGSQEELKQRVSELIHQDLSTIK